MTGEAQVQPAGHSNDDAASMASMWTLAPRLNSWGGKESRNLSRAEASAGSTAPRTSTAQVPHVPRPRQLINCELLLCGLNPRRSSAVRNSSPVCTPSMMREPSAVVQVMLWCGRIDGVRQRTTAKSDVKRHILSKRHECSRWRARTRAVACVAWPHENTRASVVGL